MRSPLTDLHNGNCILKITGIRDSLKAAERRLAEYVLHNPDQAVRLTMEELAVAASSSYATIYRFVKRLGFSGFKEFKASLVGSMVRGDTIEDQLNSLKIDKTTPTERICADIYDFSCRIIKDCVSIIDTKIIDQAVELMLKANAVFFIGTGTSYISALYAYCKFFRLGFNCSHEPSPTFFQMRCALMTGNEVLFAISSSGRTKTIVDAVKIARNNNVQVIGLSDFAISPLTRLSNINLHTTPRNAGAYMNIDLPLLIGQITIIDILHLCCCARLGDKARRAYATTKTEVDKEKV